MLEIYITPGLCTILYYNEALVIYGLSSKLVFLFVQPVVFAQPQNTLAYCEICHFPINCGFIMFYSTGQRLERLAGGKRSSLLGLFVSYQENEVL
jgi:hypothetical protein